MATVRQNLVLGILCCVPVLVAAEDSQARIDYQIHCQGCHLPDAEGVPGRVPRMSNFLGYYLHSEEGRRFIIQVPGAATANLSDARLTELMNWLLLRYSNEQLPKNFRLYREEEVGRLRANLEPDPEVTRMRILRAIAEELPSLATELGNINDY